MRFRDREGVARRLAVGPVRPLRLTGINTSHLRWRHTRSLPDLFRACVAAKKVRMQGARSAVWLFQISDEQRGRRAFLAATRRASLALGALRRCKALVVNDTTARFAPCTASQSEARACAKQVRQAPRVRRTQH